MVDFEKEDLDFRERIRLERKKLKLNQEQLSNLLIAKGVDTYPTAIGKIEGGARPARIDELRALAELFDCSFDVLLGRTAADPNRDKAFVMDELSRWVTHVLGEVQGLHATLQSRVDALAGFVLDDDEAAALEAAEQDLLDGGLRYAANQAMRAVEKMSVLQARNMVAAMTDRLNEDR